jgi:hypothetical protein
VIFKIIEICVALFSLAFTVQRGRRFSVMREFPLIKTMLISDYLLSSGEIIVKDSSLWNFVQNAVAGLNPKKLKVP